MKTIGLIGGMSWESTAEYYRVLNRTVQARLGGQHSAKLVMVSVDFDEIVALQQSGDWDAAGAMLAGLVLVPILNLMTPIFGIALMVHVHKRLRPRTG